MKYQCPFCHEYDINEKNEEYFCNNCSKKISKDEIIHIKNINNAKNGQFNCPGCGSSEVMYSKKNKALECKYCGYLFNEKTDDDNKIKKLKGIIKTKGSIDYDETVDNLVVIKCDGCGAEVVIDINDKPVARCQWCHSILTLNDIAETGRAPDKILPFKLSREEAVSKMKEFLQQGRMNYFANEKFKNGVTVDNIMGVYMPYLQVDVNAHAALKGIGKHIINYKKSKKKKKYNIEIYDIEREFDLYVDDLIFESNTERKDLECDARTNNIINAVLPFDTENALKYTGNYLIGFNSEKRNLNQNDFRDEIEKKIIDISKEPLKKDSNFYNDGIEWKECNTKIVGSKWISIFLPIWLYSFQENQDDRKILHYIAVNGRTGKVMGSAPIDIDNTKKSNIAMLFAFGCILLPFVLILVSIILTTFKHAYLIILALIILIILLILLGVVALKTNYKSAIVLLRNKNAKFDYAKRTNKSFSHIVKNDKKINVTQELR